MMNDEPVTDGMHSAAYHLRAQATARWREAISELAASDDLRPTYAQIVSLAAALTLAALAERIDSHGAADVPEDVDHIDTTISDALVQDLRKLPESLRKTFFSKFGVIRVRDLRACDVERAREWIAGAMREVYDR